MVKSKCRNGDLELKLTFGTAFFSSELVEPKGVDRDKLPPTAGRGSELLPMEPKIGCCCTRPWVALKSLESAGVMPGLR